MDKLNYNNSSDIKISIIVTIYNREKYLEKCINSILNQNFKDFELILVNDGSTDKSGEICDKFANKDDRIKVIHKKNGGVSSARNIGIENAIGEYIGFVDSDDYIKENMYETLHKVASEYSSDIVICKCIDIMDNETYEEKENMDTKTYIEHYSNIEALKNLYTNKNTLFVSPVNKIYKKTLFDEIKYDINRIHEDEFIIHRILYLSKKITFVDKELYFYTISNDDSIMRSSYSIKRLDSVYALKDRVVFLREKKQKSISNLAQRYYIEMFIGNYYKAKRELKNVDKELKLMKKDFDKEIIHLYRNPYYNWKEKLILTAFSISPKLYKYYNDRKKL